MKRIFALLLCILMLASLFPVSALADDVQGEDPCAEGHSYNDGVTTPPTCTAAGYTTFTCSRCGDSYTTEGEAALGHSYDDGVATDPTCTAAGYTTFTCSRCGDSYTTEGEAALGHSYDDGVATDPTCTAAGYTTFTCSRCGDSYRVEGEAALGHDYDDGVVTDPTCTEAGYTTFTCSRCGDSYTTEGEAALGHDYDDGVVTDPTCTEAGFTTFTCSRCGDSYTTEGEAALDHDYGNGIMTDPTCTEAGFTTFTCTRCGDSYTTEGEVALGHDYDEGVVTADPTADKEGVKTFTCSRCGDTYTEPVPKLEIACPAFSQSRAVSGVMVSVSAPEGVFPEGAKLSVTAVPAATAERDDNVNVALSFTFDIKVLDKDGQEVQPKDEQSVTVAFSLAAVADENLETQVYHIDDSGSASALDVDTAGQTAVVETGSFSLYQVEFTYEKKQYVLPGDQSVPLSEILQKVELVGEVTAVACSNTALFSASRETGEWVVTAHQAFSSTEWMKVTINGLVYEITVTDSQVTEGEYTLDVDEDGNAMITGYDGTGGALVIPEQLGDHRVTGIGASAFSGCSSIASLTIPENVTYIGGNAFYHCTGLKTVTFEAGNTGINIEPSAFELCTGLTTVTLSDRVTAIPKSMFQGCLNLTTVTFPAKLASIGESAFESCGKLTTGDLSATDLTSIGADAFQSCISLAGLKFPTGKPLSIGDRAFYVCSSITNLTIPANVTGIGANAFSGCTGLTTVTFAASSDSISIGAFAFSGCGGLTTVTLSDRVTAIPNSMFEDCDSLESVTIPNSVTTIGQDAFSGCTSLTNVTIPNSVTTIGQDAFYGCSKLSSVTIPSSVTTIGQAAFYGCSSLSSVTIPSSVTTIGQAAFSGCTDLTSVEFEAGQTSISIGDSAFSGCTGLTDVALSNRVSAISDSMFQGCSSLERVTIPNTVTSIGDDAFRDCDNLTDIYYHGTETEWNALSPEDFLPDNDEITVHTFRIDNIPSLSYSNTPLTPAVTVRDENDDPLTPGTDYTLKYQKSDGTEISEIKYAGDYKVIAEGKGTYDGKSTEKAFKVDPITLTITAKNVTCTYTGNIQGEGDTVYNDPAVIATKVTVAGNLAEGDVLAQIELFSQGQEVGDYEITVKSCVVKSGETDKTANYDITCVKGTLKITPPHVTVTFNANGHGTAPKAQEVEKGAKASKPADLTAKGWVFGGWYTTKDCKTAFDFSKAVNADTTVYAKWTKVEYTVTKGDFTRWWKGGLEGVSITVKRSPDDANCYAHFDSVEIDGKTLKDSAYTAKKGSTVVYLKPATLQKLSLGHHDVSIVFDDGSAEAVVSIHSGSPKTGDSSTPGTWAALMLLSGCGFFSIVYTFSKKARKKET